MTFTKLFASITESTIWCEDDQTRLVWITMLAMANKNGFVFGSIPGLANRARVPVESVRAAIFKFQQPDRDSRTKDFGGRRIEEVDGGWRLITYDKHRAIRDEEERREYMRNFMREKRAVSNVSIVSHSKPPLSQAEAEAEADKIKSKSARFTRPSLAQVTTYITERKSPVDPQRFLDFYESKGWKVGNQPMKNWKAAVRTWERRDGWGSAPAQLGRSDCELHPEAGLTDDGKCWACAAVEHRRRKGTRHPNE